MIAREAWRVWLDLQRETLERVHPSWLATLSADLVMEARSHPAGRRFLAGRLHDLAPVLLGLALECGATVPHDHPASPCRLSEATWLLAALKEPAERALDLGSLALAANLRTVVTRSAVAELRSVLGPARYERILAGRSNGLSDASGAVRLAPSRGTDFAEQLMRRGATELEAYAASVHPACAESVRLSFHRGWWSAQPHALSLAPEVVESCLRFATEPS